MSEGEFRAIHKSDDDYLMILSDPQDELDEARRAMGACPICKTAPEIQYEPGVTFISCCRKDKANLPLQDIVEPDWSPHQVKTRWNARVVRLTRS